VATKSNSEAKYIEVINPPLSFIAFLLFMYLSIAIAIWAAFDFLPAALTMFALLLTVPLIWRKLQMRITVSDELRIDQAHISLKYLIEPFALNQREYRALRSHQADARSFHATRAWLKRGVRVKVNDERDPTTYWLIGCKRPEDLVKALVNKK
jgi:ABC-type transport system involved in cytochrome bd biosynthesis fused ATPase/permease subunit